MTDQPEKLSGDDLTFERTPEPAPPATRLQSVGEAMHGNGPLPPPEVSHPGWDDEED